ncbi:MULTISPECIES: hypothetical protein [Nocardioides]|uniref:hypothetical protein n=1 Tax=Nocardioides TaxID=1839 RepID=UPI00056B30E8|nr:MULTISPECIES: hypothetical protein [Nocardioides]
MDPRRLLPYLLALTALAVLTTAGVALFSQRSSPPGAQAEASPPPAGASTPRDVLAGWDARRSAAWAAGDVAALRELYVAGSSTGRADARMLAAYVDRGLRVDGLATQVLALEVLDEAADELTVRITDRVAGGVVTGEAGGTPLPRDRPTTRTLVLRRVDGEWLVVTVRDQDSAADSTSRTSTSWKS